jgi:hypothetical protein
MDGTPTKPIGPVGGHGIKWTVAKTILTMTSVNEQIIISIIIIIIIKWYNYNIPRNIVTVLVTAGNSIYHIVATRLVDLIVYTDTLFD